MEDFRLDIIIDSGPSARSIQLNLPRFTLVGATTRSGMLTAPLRSRFGLVNRLDYYSREELAAIVERSAGLLDIPVRRDGSLEIASRAYVLENGSVRFSGLPAELLASAELKRAYLGG